MSTNVVSLTFPHDTPASARTGATHSLTQGAVEALAEPLVEPATPPAPPHPTSAQPPSSRSFASRIAPAQSSRGSRMHIAEHRPSQKYDTRTNKIRKLRRHAEMVVRPFKPTAGTVTYALNPLQPLITFSIPPVTSRNATAPRAPIHTLPTPDSFPPIVNDDGSGNVPAAARVPAPFQRTLYQCWGFASSKPEDLTVLLPAQTPPARVEWPPLSHPSSKTLDLLLDRGELIGAGCAISYNVNH